MRHTRTIRLTEAEDRAICEAAEHLGTAPSVFVRAWALAKALDALSRQRPCRPGPHATTGQTFKPDVDDPK